ncbi:MAG TPA: 6-phosphogluconolactonase [Rhizomicrobium sp.]|nr:6-phosphogluconolactonase [Rhizomicrobium sp.]
MNEPVTFEPSVIRFDDAESMTAALADKIVARLFEGVRRRDAASLVVSGGTTPGILFDALATRTTPWDRVFVTATDERWVSPDDDRSNEKLVRSRLIRGQAAAAHFVRLMTRHASPAEAEADVDRAVGAMPRPFDVTLLGMGNDGHTASLFPGAKELPLALDYHAPALVRAITPANVATTGPRMSLSLRAILASRLIVVLIRGDEKLETFRLATAGHDALEMPIRAVLHQSGVPVEVYWSP